MSAWSELMVTSLCHQARAGLVDATKSYCLCRNFGNPKSLIVGTFWNVLMCPQGRVVQNLICPQGRVSKNQFFSCPKKVIADDVGYTSFRSHFSS